MTQSFDIQGNVPEWDTADRMRKSLRFANIGVQEMADYLDVSRNTVGTWINGRIDPSVQTLRLWALRTGVDYDWLKDGATPDDGPSGGETGASCQDRTDDRSLTMSLISTGTSDLDNVRTIYHGIPSPPSRIDEFEAA